MLVGRNDNRDSMRVPGRVSTQSFERGVIQSPEKGSKRFEREVVSSPFRKRNRQRVFQEITGRWRERYCLDSVEKECE